MDICFRQGSVLRLDPNSERTAFLPGSDLLSPEDVDSHAFPVFRDLAGLFPAGVPVGDVLAMVRELSPEIREAEVFDVFTGEKIGTGKKSVAFRVRIQAEGRTLTDADVHSIHTKVVNLLENRFGGTIRTS